MNCIVSQRETMEGIRALQLLTLDVHNIAEHLAAQNVVCAGMPTRLRSGGRNLMVRASKQCEPVPDNTFIHCNTLLI